MENLKDKISVFGHDISLDLKGSIVTMERISEEEVLIKKESQTLQRAQYPVNVKEKYGKTADEFIREFEKSILEATKK